MDETAPPIVDWPAQLDEILAGDLTAALAYLTPAGGVVLTPVAPIGLRDRCAGTVGFTTSLGFGKKVSRMRADPRVALVYHAREHGLGGGPGFAVVQGCATITATTASERDELGERASRYLGPVKRGRFWDRWLAAYYIDRVLVTIEVARILWWHDSEATGSPEVIGPPLGAPAPSTAPPAKGTGARIDVDRLARRLRPRHRLAGWRGGDGFPVVVPVGAPTRVEGGLALVTRCDLRPSGPLRGGGCSRTSTAPSSSGCASSTPPDGSNRRSTASSSSRTRPEVSSRRPTRRCCCSPTATSRGAACAEPARTAAWSPP